MNQMNTPEVALSKALEFKKTDDEESAILVINEYILNVKKKHWNSNQEQLILLFVELTVKNNKIKYLKDGLNYYRSLSQNYNIESLANVLTKTKESVEDKFLKAQKSYQGIKVDIQDLDSEDSPELFFLYSFEDEIDTKEKEDLINSQKFIWETYKILLDLTKTNSKLLSLYAQILKSAFNFCKENKRKMEFKRLCDSVRGYLQTLIKTEKKQFFQNKVQISRPEVLKILIQIRINLLDTATELEQWMEAFKTAEDIIFLMDKFEKQTDDGAPNSAKVKKAGKIPPAMKLEFYSDIEKLLWISDYHLYHAHAVILIKDLANKALKSIKNAKNQDKIKELKTKLEKYDLDNLDNRIVLATLVTPFKNTYTNYLPVGDELFEHEKEIETQTCHRMMGILKLSVVPSRKNLLNFIESNQIVNSCDEMIQTLYNLLENEKNPLTIGKKGAHIVSYLRSHEKFEKYADLISKNLILRTLIMMSKSYNSVSFKRLGSIFPWSTAEELENIISENTRVKVINCTIDHSKDLVKFNNSEGIRNTFNETLLNFLGSVERISSDIIQSDSKNKKKFNAIRQALYNEIHSHNQNSLTIYDALINGMELTSKKLEEYLREKESYIENLKETQEKERREQKEKDEEERKMMKELLKDEQKKKEFDIQLKKYLIDRIKVYTGVLLIEGKKVKLDDLLKDLAKVSDEQLIKMLEKEEYEFKTKKEKRFRQIAKDTDYVIREFRRRDYDLLRKNLEDDERIYNETVEKENKKSYDEKIGQKSNFIKIKPYKEKYFNNIMTQREAEYEEKMQEFSESLDKRIKEDLMKEMGASFKAFVEDFKKQTEVAAQNSFRPGFDFVKKGDKFKKDDIRGSRFTTTTTPLTEFARSSKATTAPTEPPRTVTDTKSGFEIKKGANFVSNPTPPETISTTSKVEFAKGSNMQRDKESDKKVEKDIIIKKGEQAEKKETTIGAFKRGEKSEKVDTLPLTRTEFKKGVNANVQPKEEEKKVVPKDTTTKTSTDTSFKRAVVTPTVKKEEEKKEEKTITKSTASTTKTTTSTNANASSTGGKTDNWRNAKK